MLAIAGRFTKPVLLVLAVLAMLVCLERCKLGLCGADLFLFSDEIGNLSVEPRPPYRALLYLFPERIYNDRPVGFALEWLLFDPVRIPLHCPAPVVSSDSLRELHSGCLTLPPPPALDAAEPRRGCPRRQCNYYRSHRDLHRRGLRRKLACSFFSRALLRCCTRGCGAGWRALSSFSGASHEGVRHHGARGRSRSRRILVILLRIRTVVHFQVARPVGVPSERAAW